ncbi:hypothetical protein [endosymbiont GvMRE of Glomus versiforme]|uniref:hypothetical protein n=1 Tax=endosymbiont GvMRE of Glomus versiforme TaxID=2039283 RepID=UPI000EEDDAC6|nr:hypothetical protein [endosymbiont GvMRE of Glomus versiforme]RHZ37269.1 hypothetical protein GvMRE_I1g450 [endosymbiont GvMRE of Glomus versiforme]RHZ37461.1 hypothetical protein GvMRE_I1g633 [endosymbiont GvMRE of Glomus versiforme]
MVGRKPQLQRQARTITVRGGDEVYTRLSKRQYETRREHFDDNPPSHLAGFDYDDWVGMGSQGGRPRKWTSEAERKKTARAKAKLARGEPLTHQERELLGLVKKRPGAYQSTLGRAMTSQERKAKWKAARKS